MSKNNIYIFCYFDKMDFFKIENLLSKRHLNKFYGYSALNATNLVSSGKDTLIKTKKGQAAHSIKQRTYNQSMHVYIFYFYKQK